MWAALFAVSLAVAAPVAAGDIVLGFPVDCTLGQTCHIQHLMDRDDGPAVQDFNCGALTYEGHKGTDFALPTLVEMRRGVNVLAAAPGVVTAARDGMADTSYDPAQADRVEGRECGNGMVIRHGDGWETQYCHLKSGSVLVRPGDRLERGTVLGQIGLSGKTTFPHLHLSLRKDGKKTDPFDISGAGACDTQLDSVWAETPDYVPGGLILAGFADHMPSYAAVKAGETAMDSLPEAAGALVLYGLAYGGHAGDRIELHITGPEGEVAKEDTILERNQAQFFRATGRRLRGDSWPRGTYDGTVRMLRDGVELDQKHVVVTVR